MTRVLPAVFVLALSAPAFAQAVDGEGAKQLSENLSRYVGSQAIDKGVLKVSVEGDAYKIAFDFKALAGMLPKQDLLKFDFAPYVLLAKPQRRDMGYLGGFHDESFLRDQRTAGATEHAVLGRRRQVCRGL
ncbi:hypothetical protein [Mesorhizobium sp.]|uniref:hypothetical protein n=1 Tax=Mesorhizobium sp. TaxID=1871066 RepID=UPI0025D63553|nr:hypothetical protein [Mesorhizobium sp.]